MIALKQYKCLKYSIFSNGIYKIVPIRFEDRFHIMKWRNEQIYHLRQSKPLTESDQNNYFNNTIPNLFEEINPKQILFSFLENNKCIGYGGLVHINWIDRNAEISFIMDTKLEKKHFYDYWTIFLGLIENLASCELFLHKLYVYAFDLRPHLYDVLINNNYYFEAKLNQHCFYEDKYIDVIIHSKII